MNNSTEDYGEIIIWSTSEWWFLVIFCSLQILIGSIANFVVIVTIFLSRQLRRRSEDHLILNLAITDFFSLTTLLPWHIHFLNQPQIDTKEIIACVTLKGLFVTTGTNIIFCLAIDRFVAVVYPLRHPMIINTRFMTVLSWGTAVLVAVGRYLGLKLELYKHIDAFLVIHFSLFLVVSVALYAVVFYYTFKQGRKLLNQRRTAANENFSSCLQFKKTLKTFVLMCLCYATYLPVIVFNIHFSFVLGLDWIQDWFKETIWMGSFLIFNSCINPFVYAWRTKRFRKEFRKKIWSRCFHRTANETSVPPLSHDAFRLNRLWTNMFMSFCR